MSAHELMFAAAGLILAGVVCLVGSDVAEGRNHRRWLLLAQLLWRVGGVVALIGVAIMSARLFMAPMSISAAAATDRAFILLGGSTIAFAFAGLEHAYRSELFRGRELFRRRERPVPITELHRDGDADGGESVDVTKVNPAVGE